MSIFESIANALDLNHPIWGHGAAGLLLMAFGSYFLWRCLHNARSLVLLQGNGQTSFAEAFIPDPDLRHLNKVAKIMTIANGTLMILFLFNEGWVHVLLFFPYLAVGWAALLESQGKVPLDTHRILYAMACACQGWGMYDHAHMKPLASDEKMHIAIALTYLFTAIIIGYSVMTPTSTTAYIMGWASVVLQGTWLVMDGLILKFVTNERLSPHLVYTYFGSTIMGLAMAVVVTAAYAVPSELMQSSNGNNSKMTSFRPLSHPYDDDEDDNDDHDYENNQLLPTQTQTTGLSAI